MHSIQGDAFLSKPEDSISYFPVQIISPRQSRDGKLSPFYSGRINSLKYSNVELRSPFQEGICPEGF